MARFDYFPPGPDLAPSSLAIRRRAWLAPGEARYYTEGRVADRDGVRSAHDHPSDSMGEVDWTCKSRAYPRYKERH